MNEKCIHCGCPIEGDLEAMGRKERTGWCHRSTSTCMYAAVDKAHALELQIDGLKTMALQDKAINAGIGKDLDNALRLLRELTDAAYEFTQECEGSKLTERERQLKNVLMAAVQKAITEGPTRVKRKVTPQNCGCGIDSCLLEFHRADCPLRLPVPPPLTVDAVVPDGKCWLCGRAATGKKGAEPRCETHL